MPLVRAPRLPRASSSTSSPLAFLPTSIRGRILALVGEEGVFEALQTSPASVADFCASLPPPEEKVVAPGKTLAQVWRGEMNSVLSSDTKHRTRLYLCGLRRFRGEDGQPVKGLYTWVDPQEAGVEPADPLVDELDGDEGEE